MLTKYMSQGTFDKIFKRGDSDFKILKISIASSMNDANEGKTLYQFFIDCNNINSIKDIENFRKNNTKYKVFIASFTENPGDTIGMWNTMYGDLCKGISYTFNPIGNNPPGSNQYNPSSNESILIQLLNSNNATPNNATPNNATPNNTNSNELSYYRVAYYNNHKQAEYRFSIFSHNELSKIIEVDPLSTDISKEFNDLNNIFNNIYQSITQSPEERKRQITSLQENLMLLSHLVKDITYYPENEVRLVNITDSWHDNENRIGNFDKTHIEFFNTGHKMEPLAVTLSPKLTQDPKYLDHYNYVFSGTVTINPSVHLYNFGG